MPPPFTTRLAALALGGALVATGACSGDANPGVADTTTTTAAVAAATTTTAGIATTASSTSTEPAGHPTAGFHLAAELADGFADRASDFGWDVSVATTRGGDPIVVYVVHDTNGDGDGADSTLFSVTWSAADGEFADPVEVGPSDPDSSDGEVSAATDAATGTIGVAYQDADGALVLTTSGDDGDTWSAPIAIRPKAGGAPRTPALAMAGGVAMVAFADDTNGITIARVDGTDVTEQPAPVAGGSIIPLAPAIAASPGGAFAAAYFQTDATQPSNVVVDYLALGGAASAGPIRALDSQNVQNDSPSVGLAFAGANPLVGVQMDRPGDAVAEGFWTATSPDGGVTFAAPVPVPPDASAGQGFVTRVVADGKGAGAFAYTPNSGTGDDVCGKPKLARSPDLVTWQTCSPDVDNTRAISPGAPALAVGAGDVLLLAFANFDTSTDDPAYIGPGVWLWLAP
jgi:hypothetical protein